MVLFFQSLLSSCVVDKLGHVYTVCTYEWHGGHGTYVPVWAGSMLTDHDAQLPNTCTVYEALTCVCMCVCGSKCVPSACVKCIDGTQSKNKEYVCMYVCMAGAVCIRCGWGCLRGGGPGEGG